MQRPRKRGLAGNSLPTATNEHLTMKQAKETVEKLAIPSNAAITVEKGRIQVRGPYGELERAIDDPLVMVSVDAQTVKIVCQGETKRERRKIGTWKSHLKNMFAGATHGHSYKLKVCSGHFPMNISVTDKEFVVKNFLGEKVPRRIGLKNGVKVSLDGELVTVESADKERAGQTAADIEQLCRIVGRDSRIFQDGIWIVEKDGKTLK
jgi:large subunit ribosomal protein L6